MQTSLEPLMRWRIMIKKIKNGNKLVLEQIYNKTSEEANFYTSYYLTVALVWLKFMHPWANSIFCQNHKTWMDWDNFATESKSSTKWVNWVQPMEFNLRAGNQNIKTKTGQSKWTDLVWVCVHRKCKLRPFCIVPHMCWKLGSLTLLLCLPISHPPICSQALCQLH